MLNLFRAEWAKINGNRWATGMLVWVFPAGAAGILVIMTLVALLAPPEIRQNFGLVATDTSAQWTTSMITAWNIPNQMFGRVILIAFTATAFAGEYQWGTWKNLLQRQARMPLLITKFVTVTCFIVVSFAATALIAGIGMAVPVTIVGGTYGPPLGEALQSGFLRGFAIQAATTITGTIIAATYAMLGAMITRSILGSVLAGTGLLLLEYLSLALFSLLGFLFNRPGLVTLFRWMPSYNLSNIVTQLNNEPSSFPNIHQYAPPHSLEASLFILAVWVVGLLALALVLFYRQDVTT